MRTRRTTRPDNDRPPGSPAATDATASRSAPAQPTGVTTRVRRRFRSRVTLMLAATLGLGICAVTACALFVPGSVFGAGRTEPPTIPDQANGQPQINQRKQSDDRPAVGDLLVTLPWGSGEGEVGLERPVEGLTRGPEALAATPDGRIAVLDSVNRRVLFLDDQGRLMLTAALPLAEPRFLAVDDERVHVLDCDADRQVVSLDWSGAVSSVTVLPELPDAVSGLFATAEGPCLEVAHDSVFLVSTPLLTAGLSDTADEQAREPGGSTPASLRSLGGRPVGPGLARVAKVTFARGEHARIRMLEIGGGAGQATQKADFRQPLAPGRAIEHLVSVDGDGRGGLVVGARLLDSGPPGASRAALVLTRLAVAQGDGAGPCRPVDPGRAQTLLLADSPYAYLGQPYVVAPDGRVLQPVGSNAGYSIMVHRFAAGDSTVRDTGVQP